MAAMYRTAACSRVSGDDSLSGTGRHSREETTTRGDAFAALSLSRRRFNPAASTEPRRRSDRRGLRPKRSTYRGWTSAQARIASRGFSAPSSAPASPSRHVCQPAPSRAPLPRSSSVSSSVSSGGWPRGDGFRSARCRFPTGAPSTTPARSRASRRRRPEPRHPGRRIAGARLRHARLRSSSGTSPRAGRFGERPPRSPARAAARA